jgi:rod shape-determining protein MreC
LLVVTSILLLTLDFRGFGPLERAQSGLRDVLAPVRSVVATVLSPVTNAGKGIFDYRDVRNENRDLRAELEDLRGRQLQGEVDSATLQQLLKERDIPYVGDIPRVVARLTARPAGNFDEGRIEIDKGSSAGLKVNMCVVTAAGLVGKLVQVDGTRSIVELVTSPDLAVGVRIGDDVTVARGAGRGNPLRATEGVSRDTKAGPGDPVLTSGGASSRFPPDIPVGRVASVDRATGTAIVTVDLAAAVEDIDFVTVLLYEAPR